MSTLVVCSCLALGAPRAGAQGAAPDSAPAPALAPTYWRHVGYGVTASLLLHEAAHVMTAIAVGGRPGFGFDALRPTIYSGLDAHTQAHKQFLFSAAGLTAQTLADEAILDIPHARGGAFERGILAGGIATATFYLTIGRTGSVSDIVFMARTHGMTKTQSTLVYGGLAALHVVRMAGNARYANFFARPRDDGGMDVGLNITGR
jgi:hypothetical protein